MSAPANELPQGRLKHAVFVFEWPVRVWHWLTAISIVVLAATGYYIGNPPLPNTPGEAVDAFTMGYMRFAHFAAGYVLAILFVGRFYWAIVGNEYARELFFPPVFRVATWKDVWFRMKYYLFIEKDVPQSVGPNGLEVLSAFTMFTLPMIFIVLTGFALYAEGTGANSWQAAAFGWVRYLFGDSQALHTWHHIAMWVLIIYAMIHVYLVIRGDVMSRQSEVSTMISGVRMFKD